MNGREAVLGTALRLQQVFHFMQSTLPTTMDNTGPQRCGTLAPS